MVPRYKVRLNHLATKLGNAMSQWLSLRNRRLYSSDVLIFQDFINEGVGEDSIILGIISKQCSSGAIPIQKKLLLGA